MQAQACHLLFGCKDFEALLAPALACLGSLSILELLLDKLKTQSSLKSHYTRLVGTMRRAHRLGFLRTAVLELQSNGR